MLLHSPPYPHSLRQLVMGCGLLPESGHGTSQTEVASVGLRAIPLGNGSREGDRSEPGAVSIPSSWGMGALPKIWGEAH